MKFILTNFCKILSLKQSSLKPDFFYNLKRLFAPHKKYRFHAKMLQRALQRICLSRFFCYFQALKKVSEFNKKRALPRIQVIPSSDVSDEEKKIDDLPKKDDSYNEFCKDIDKSIVYNQVLILINNNN